MRLVLKKASQPKKGEEKAGPLKFKKATVIYA